MPKLDALLQRKMTRRQFLATLGMAVGSLFGLSTLMGMLTHGGPQTTGLADAYGEHHYGQ